MFGKLFDVTVTTSFDESEALQKIKEATKALSDNRAFVGIPIEANATHSVDDGNSAPISNADLMYIHTNGSPVNGIPARDILNASMNNKKEQVSQLLENAAQAALDGSKDGVMQAYEKAGMQGANIAKAWFTDSANDWDDNKDETIERKGSSRPLIDSGELRNAITHVVDKEGARK